MKYNKNTHDVTTGLNPTLIKCFVLTFSFPTYNYQWNQQAMM